MEGNAHNCGKHPVFPVNKCLTLIVEIRCPNTSSNEEIRGLLKAKSINQTTEVELGRSHVKKTSRRHSETFSGLPRKRETVNKVKWRLFVDDLRSKIEMSGLK